MGQTRTSRGKIPKKLRCHSCVMSACYGRQRNLLRKLGVNNLKYQPGTRVPKGRIGKIALAIAWLSLMGAPAFAQPTAQPPFFTPGNLVVSVTGCGVYGG